MPPTLEDAPTTERGYAGNVGGSVGPTVTASAGTYLLEPSEDTPELRFPASATVFDRMRKTDGQVGAGMRAITLPILSAGRRLAGEDVRPEVMRACEAEFGLDVATAGRARRRRQGIVFAEHLRHALLMLPYGFLPFEQVYEVGPPLPGLEDTVPAGNGGLVAHVRKLAPRMPRTLLAVNVARDGGLAGITQNPPPGEMEAPFIPTDRLVMYVNDREGSDWTGNSLLRTAYKHHLIKDALLRLGPMVVERNGMGVPVVTVAEGKSRAKGLAIAKAFRAGSEAGAVLEEGYSLTLVGTTGSTRDELPLVEYHDKATSRSLLTMLLDLGQTGGLGDAGIGATFRDYLMLSLGAITGNVADTFTEHVLRDFVELNYGPDEPYPALVFDPIDATSDPTAEALARLVEAHLLTPDVPLEQEVRRRHRLPQRVVEEVEGEPVVDPADPTGDVAASPFSNVGLPALVAANIMTAEEARALLKLPPGAPIPPDATAPFAAVMSALTAKAARATVLEPAASGDLVERLAAVTERVAALAELRAS
jgi:hypothetical protein